MDDAVLMRLALGEAERAMEGGDVPVGAAIARDGEVLALRAAAAATGSWRLDGCTLAVTLEPCAMCAGAIVLARVERLVIGAMDPKAGFAGSLGDLVRDPRLNHRVEVETGVLADECGDVLRAFFRDRRA
jgi:tRNA(adenine34) deaminase